MTTGTGTAGRPTAGLTLDESARRLAALVAAKQLEFERLGSSARATDHPSLKLALASVSAHQGRGAQLLESLLPATRDHDPVGLVVQERVRLSPPTEAASERVPDQELLDRALKALTSLVEESERLIGDLSPVSDPAARRLIGSIVEGDRKDLAALSGVRIAGKEAQVTR